MSKFYQEQPSGGSYQRGPDSAYQQEFSFSDTGSSSETASLRITPATDNGSGTESAPVLASTATDSGSGSQSAPNVAQSGNDSGTGADATPNVTQSANDSGSGSESTPSIGRTSTDSGTSSEIATLSLTVSDSGSGLESTPANAQINNDSGSGTESTNISVVSSDAGAGSDGTSIATLLADGGFGQEYEPDVSETIADSGIGAEGVPNIASSLTDSGTSTDSIQVSNSSSVGDTGTSSEPTPLITLSQADNNTSAESVSIATTNTDVGSDSETTAVAVAGADAASSSETSSLDLIPQDSGSYVESAVTSQSLSESGTGTETVPDVAFATSESTVGNEPTPDIALASGNTGSGSDGTVIYTLLSDATFGLESTPDIGSNSSEAGTGSESTTDIAFAPTDIGTEVDSQQIVASVSDIDVGSDIEQSSHGPLASDSGSIAELDPNISASLGDTGSDGENQSVSLVETDQATTSENQQVSLFASDSGSSTETQQVDFGTFLVSDGDQGTGSDGFPNRSTVVSDQGTGGDGFANRSSSASDAGTGPESAPNVAVTSSDSGTDSESGAHSTGPVLHAGAIKPFVDYGPRVNDPSTHSWSPIPTPTQRSGAVQKWTDVAAYLMDPGSRVWNTNLQLPHYLRSGTVQKFADIATWLADPMSRVSHPILSPSPRSSAVKAFTDYFVTARAHDSKRSDFGTSVDSVTSSSVRSALDTNLSTQESALVSAGNVSADAGTASNESTIESLLAVDVGSGSDGVEAGETKLPPYDLGSAEESASLQVPTSDHNSLAEFTSIDASTSASDSGTAYENGAPSVFDVGGVKNTGGTFGDLDGGTFGSGSFGGAVEGETVSEITVVTSVTDTGTSSEIAAISVSTTVSDSSFGNDGVGSFSPLTADRGSSTESTLIAATARVVSDSGISTETGTFSGIISTSGTVTDSFNRTNSTSLGTADTGQTWTAQAGTWATNGSVAYCPTNASIGAWGTGGIATIDDGLTDGTVSVSIPTLTGLASGAGVGIVGRYSDSSNYWFGLIFRSGSALLLYGGKVSGGAVSYLLDVSDGTMPQSGSCNLALTFSGNTVKLFVNGIQYGSTATDSFNNTQTKDGIWVDATTGTFIDSFNSGLISVVTSTSPPILHAGNVRSFTENGTKSFPSSRTWVPLPSHPRTGTTMTWANSAVWVAFSGSRTWRPSQGRQRTAPVTTFTKIATSQIRGAFVKQAKGTAAVVFGGTSRLSFPVAVTGFTTLTFSATASAVIYTWEFLSGQTSIVFDQDANLTTSIVPIYHGHSDIQFGGLGRLTVVQFVTGTSNVNFRLSGKIHTLLTGGPPGIGFEPSFKWQIFDPYTGETYNFRVNPNRGGSPAFDRNLSTQPILVPTMLDAVVPRAIIQEGSQVQQTLDFEGVLLDPEQFDALRGWFQKNNPVILTDDVGRSYYAVLKNFKPKRVYAANNFWKQTYSASVDVIAMESV